jgi:hypothetical protein
VALVERGDFGEGTSSRSTKLIHGGFRYLKQGNIKMVRESLHERGLLQRNAWHLVHPLAFVMPAYSAWEKAFYGFGLKVYDVLAGKLSLGKTRLLSGAFHRVCRDHQLDDRKQRLGDTHVASIERAAQKRGPNHCRDADGFLLFKPRSQFGVLPENSRGARASESACGQSVAAVLGSVEMRVAVSLTVTLRTIVTL